MSDFNGRPILVTGASGGIGGATVRHLVAAGADVIASGQSSETLEAVAADTGARVLPFDVTSEESVRDALDGLDVWGVVNCAGFGGEIATPMDTDIAVFDKVININARGTLLVIKYASRSMIRLGNGGSIVNVSSQASLVALTGHISYGSSKAAVDNITRVSALELGRHNIRVNSVNPTVVMTPMSAWYWGRGGCRRPLPGGNATGPVGDRRRDRCPDHLFAQRRCIDDYRSLPAHRRRLHLPIARDSIVNVGLSTASGAAGAA
jgi:NAD(P)-dependent dehydrogenase (short-subunit alcohol dehydrogenase family)